MLHMKVIGEMEWQKVKEKFIILTEIYMKETSNRIDKMVMENTLILLDKNIKVCGKMTCKKVKVRSCCLMDQIMKVSSNKDKDGVKVSVSWLMGQATMESG